ncbi:MAG: DUF418 domain-containing protein [Candidatus Rokuibacteriota bacterium]
MTRETPPNARVTSLDVLRGVGILGILAVHIQLFASVGAARANPTVYGDLTGANWWVWLGTDLLAEGKFISIFAMLFGAGIVVLAARRDAAAADAAGLHYRRMAGLLVIGLLHAYLLWYGDMLVQFALCGAVVFAYHRLRARRLVWLGAAVFCLGAAVPLAIIGSLPWWSAEAAARFSEAWSPSAEVVAREIARYRGGWLEQMAHRVPAAWEGQTSALAYRLLWQGVGLMLIGMGLFKIGVFSAARSTRFYIAMALGGFGTGVPLLVYTVHRNFAHGWAFEDVSLVGAQLSYFANLAVGLGWIGVVMLLCRSGWRLAPVAAVGRTALSNYLLQTVICTSIFYGHGLGLFARVDRRGQIAMVVAVWAVQLVASSWWVRRFAVGPVEWAWRSITYGHRVPLRLPSAAA